MHVADQADHARDWSDDDAVQAETIAKVMAKTPQAKAKRKAQPKAAKKKIRK